MLHPKSKVSFLILWLYSLESPLYFFFNKASRDRDYKLLPLLGPFAWALGYILDGEAEKGRPDTMQQGTDILNLGNKTMGTMGGSFVVFRGALLSAAETARFHLQKGRRWFNQYRQQDG